MKIVSKEERIKEVRENYYKKEKEFWDGIYFKNTSVSWGHKDKCPSSKKEVEKYLKKVKKIGNNEQPIFHAECFKCHSVEHLTLAICYECYIYNWAGGGTNPEFQRDKSMLQFKKGKN